MTGKRIRVLRESKSITQSELAQIVNLSQQTIDHYEKGRAEPNIDTINLLANYFGCSADYLLGRTDDPSTKDDVRQYVNDDDALEYLDELHKRPEMKTLFQVGRQSYQGRHRDRDNDYRGLKTEGRE